MKLVIAEKTSVAQSIAKVIGATNRELEGNPGKRKLNTNEPVPEKGKPDCPEWLLPEAKKEWERLADLMNQMGVLTEVDMAAYAAYLVR